MLGHFPAGFLMLVYMPEIDSPARGKYTLSRLSTVKIHGLDASMKQHEVPFRCLKAKKIILHTIFLDVGGSIYNSHTLNHLKELGLDTQKAHKTALKLRAHSVLCAHKLTTSSRGRKNPVALKVLVWSRGRLVTLQILISPSFSLVTRS